MSIAAIIGALEAAGVAKEVIETAFEKAEGIASEGIDSVVGETKEATEQAKPDAEKVSDLLTEIRMANEVAFQNQLNQNLMAASNRLNKEILDGNDVDGDKLIHYMKEMKNIFST